MALQETFASHAGMSVEEEAAASAAEAEALRTRALRAFGSSGMWCFRMWSSPEGMWRFIGLGSHTPRVGKGHMGSALMGSLQISCV